MEKTIQYLFILALVLIIVAYYVGSTSVGGTIFSGANNLLRSATGQGTNGFNAYPTNG